MLIRRLVIVALVPIALVAPTACGNSSDSGGSTTSPTTSATQTPNASSGISIAKVRTCLKAAGISTKGLPKGGGGAMPSGQPPSGMPSGAPSGMPSGPQRAGSILNNAQARQALQACGITIPNSAPSAGQ